MAFMETNFKLDDANNLVPCDASESWKFKSTYRDRCRVGLDVIGDVRVSTVFLALDHQFEYGGPPEVFETMVFGGPLDCEMERYGSWADAVAGHTRWIEKVKATTSGLGSP